MMQIAAFSTLAGIVGVVLGCVVFEVPCVTYIGLGFLVEALILQSIAIRSLGRFNRGYWRFVSRAGAPKG